jgi:5-formyltetrahydrofolate cyclo-ligase
MLAEAGLLAGQTIIATTVHELQVLDEAIPEAHHDFRVDLVVTPERVIQCGPPRRPSGLDRASLRHEQIESIPALRHIVNEPPHPHHPGASPAWVRMGRLSSAPRTILL